MRKERTRVWSPLKSTLKMHIIQTVFGIIVDCRFRFKVTILSYLCLSRKNRCCYTFFVLLTAVCRVNDEIRCTVAALRLEYLWELAGTRLTNVRFHLLSTYFCCFPGWLFLVFFQAKRIARKDPSVRTSEELLFGKKHRLLLLDAEKRRAQKQLNRERRLEIIDSTEDLNAKCQVRIAAFQTNYCDD